MPQYDHRNIGFIFHVKKNIYKSNRKKALTHHHFTLNSYGSFILSPFFFEMSCLKCRHENLYNHCSTVSYAFVCPLQDRRAWPLVTHTQAGAPPYIELKVQSFMLESVSEDWVVSQGCKVQRPSRSPDLTIVGFWLWGYLKTRF